MRKYVIALIMTCIIACSTSVVKAATLNEGTKSLRFSPPSDWICTQQSTTISISIILGIPESEIEALCSKHDIVLFFPINSQYSIQNRICIDIERMQSYHKDYSALSTEALSNIATSYMRDGNYTTYELYISQTGLTFLKLLPIHTDQGLRYVTNYNGLRVDIIIDGDIDHIQTRNVSTILLDTIRVDNNASLVLTFFWKYKAYIFVPIATLILFFSKRKRSEDNDKNSNKT